MRHVLGHPFFLAGKEGGRAEGIIRSAGSTSESLNTLSTNNSSANIPSKLTGHGHPGSPAPMANTTKKGVDPHPDVMKSDSTESSVENKVNGIRRTSRRSPASSTQSSSTSTIDSRRSFRGLRKIRMPGKL